MTKNNIFKYLGYIFLLALVGIGAYLFISNHFKKSKLINLNSDRILLYVGDSYPLEGEYTKEDGTKAKIIYSINNEKVATIDRESGVVIAKKRGKATLLASVDGDNSIYGECSIEVKPSSNKAVISNSKNIVMKSNDKQRMYISTGNVDPSRITYKSSDNSVATVDQNGVITGVSNGKTKVTVSVDGVDQATSDVNVDNTNTKTITNTNKTSTGNTDNTTKTTKTNTDNKKTENNKPKTIKVTSVTTNVAVKKMIVGDSFKLEAYVNPSNATNKTVTWSSSNTKVATVDQKGNVKAIKAGSAVISVVSKDGNKSATCKIDVASKTVDVESVGIVNKQVTLQVGAEATIDVSVLPSNATNKTITWSSSNTNVATVDKNGKVKAIAIGSADIVAKSNNGKTAMSKVTVTEPPKSHVNKIHFLDTQSQTNPYYHNDAILLESNGKFAMVDTAVGGESCNKILNYLNSVGVKKLEFVVITHWHNDHYGCNGIFRDGSGIETDKFYLKNIDATYRVSLPEAYQNDYVLFKTNAGSKAILLTENININFEDYTLELKNMTNRVQQLVNGNYCNGNHATCSENANSIVIKGTDKNSGKTFYLAADAEGYRDNNGDVVYNWEYELARSVGYVDIYKVSHHGHGSSSLTYNNPRQLMDVLKPKYSILTSARTSNNATGINDTVQYLKDVGSKVYFSGCGTVITTFPKNAGGNIEVVQKANVDTTGLDACSDVGGTLTPQP
ncbi:MAG: Ig-like domain-containing protein [Bacilli bacterium]|nr:Ig-like domain-containing protein [Bacilli bacterium]